MAKQYVEFSNPDNLPVEALTLTVTNDGVVQRIKALDPYWVEKRKLLLYESPPSGSTLELYAVDAWKAKMECYCDDLKWLLRLEHHRFWSTVLYHTQCMDTLVSFLQEATPPYLPRHESTVVNNLYVEIRRLVLIIFSRLVTNKESKTRWMSKEYLGEIIYNNFIFTIPILWDICLVYGSDNGKHVGKLISSVFTLQPKYEINATIAIEFVKETFKYIILQVNKTYTSVDPPNLPETFKGFTDIQRPSDKSHDKLTFNILRDIVIHLVDATMTLRLFVQVYPRSVLILKKTDFANSIVQLYEYGIPYLYSKLVELGNKASIAYSEVEGHIYTARTELIDIFKEMAAFYKDQVFTENNETEPASYYLNLMMDGLSERLLITDFNACYPIDEDLEILRQACPTIDTEKIEFIRHAVYSNFENPRPQRTSSGNVQDIPNGDYRMDPEEQPGPSGMSTYKNDQVPDNVKVDSLISEVKDVLPHLGDGFILKCLEYYDFKSERVVNAILEDTLAESLRVLDRELPIIPEDPVDNKFLETGIQRLNIFNGDEFDIMTRDDVDLSRIHRGKRKSKYKDLKAMLDDKEDVKKMAEVYSKYNLVCDEREYSDEYDDTYDSDSGYVMKGDDVAEDPGRPFVTPRVLRPKGVPDNQEQSEEESETEDQQPSGSRNRMDFCVNPEEMRARREASFQARRGKGHRPAPPPKSKDVVGKPKGQGQEKEVLVNRERKEKNKSSRGNHNRRQGAQWKRTQGMMPS